ncbi:MAG: TetR/AcrR family transcriptional regulator [Chitinophagaceae bacterium]|jgi:AcrR family transcriptional regulator|nr:TetR/AcrR family transcriptional regulator [Chitinophagaceae bacterium]
MPDTKTRIIEVAGKLFFHEGIASIRLQQIADGAGISVGNLAYHFRNKEALVQAVYENLFTELSEILAQYMAYPQLLGFDKQFSAMYQFYQKNSFTFNNSWEIERNYPEIQKEWLTVSNKLLLQIRKRIEYNIQNGFIRPEPYKGAYEVLANSLLLNINCWISQQMLRGKQVREDSYKRHLWGVLYPTFSEKGVQEFKEIIAPIIF